MQFAALDFSYITSGLLPDLGMANLSGWSLEEPITDSDFLPVKPAAVTDDDPLISLAEVGVRDLNAFFSMPGGTRHTRVVRSVAARLQRSSACLPEGYTLAVFGGWRDPSLQAHLDQVNGVTVTAPTKGGGYGSGEACLLYTSPSPRDRG